MLPCENITAFVLGTGADLPVEKLGRLDHHFTVGVNRIWKHGFVPTVSFWVDAGIYEECPSHFDRTLCICEASAKAQPYHIALMPRPGRLARYLNPNFCYLRPNTGVVGALWAISMGCYPVVLLGMGCEDDGRPPHQLNAMRKALEEVEAMKYRPRGAHFPTIWRWSGDEPEFDDNMHNYYVQPCLSGRRLAEGRRLVDNIREFYGR